jgi:ubiquinone/menaquinone biosynthesis C-methylase UbiE
VSASSSAGLLGDTPSRDYSRKLKLFNAHAQREIRQLMATLELRPGMRILDAGCGTGEALGWFQEAVGTAGTVVGVDLSAAHVSAARGRVLPQTEILQCDLMSAPFAPASFDLVWCLNTINHLADRTRAAVHLASLLKPGGRIVLAQSSLLPDMYFAWDSRLERLTNEAVRQYYRDRYGLSELDLTAVRSIVGVLRQAQLRHVTARTFMIERVSPVGPADEAYLCEAIFRDTWGERLRSYLPEEDFAALGRLCDSRHPQFALRRPDFHFLQSFTLAVGQFQP